jgi:hypothetical protein
MLIVHTNDDRYAKLIVQAGKFKVSDEVFVPVLTIERFVTYKEAEERAVRASGQNIPLYAGFHFHLDRGQIIPEKLGGDMIVVADEKEKDSLLVKPLGKARFYLLTDPIEGIVPKKAPKLEVGEMFETRFFNGTYKLYDDGRRSGELKLQVHEDGSVTGAFYTDRDGTKYEVEGKLGPPKHAINFTIKFPRTEQTFQGFLFTGNGKAIAGITKLQGREAGFYATREEK